MSLSKALAAGRTVLSDWRWTPFLLQRGFRSAKGRAAGARLMTRLLPPPGQADSPSVGALADLLIGEGQARLGRLLTPAQCDEIRQHLMERPLTDTYRPEVPPWLPLEDGRHAHSHVGYHDHGDVVRTPHLLEIANRPEILGIVERFLGCRPTIAYMTAWWSYPTGIEAQQAENFHRDVDDWRFVKLFLYLTDVDESKGPHVYVKKSANVSNAGAIRRLTDEEVRAEHSADDIVYMTGSAGESFLENTYGIHKGQPVLAGHRLLFQVVYSITPLPYGPKRPVIGAAEATAVTGAAFDPFVNRVYVAKR
jgi:hypothetical protein